MGAAQRGAHLASWLSSSATLARIRAASSVSAGSADRCRLMCARSCVLVARARRRTARIFSVRSHSPTVRLVGSSAYRVAACISLHVSSPPSCSRASINLSIYPSTARLASACHQAGTGIEERF